MTSEPMTEAIPADISGLSTSAPGRPTEAAPAPGEAQGKLVSLEAGRFIAATLVLLYHYTTVIFDYTGTLVLADIFRPGHVGVPYFFVLSGFIIHHVHRRDIGRPRAAGRFLIRRAIRLYPIFLLISLVMLAGFLAVPALAGERDLNIIGVFLDLTLLPHKDAILSISWSLRHEIVFYLLFTLVLLWGAIGYLPIALWIAGSFIGALLWPELGTLGLGSLIASPLNLGFGLGIAASLAMERNVKLPGARSLLGVAGTLLAVLWATEWYLGRGTDHSISVLGIAGYVGYLSAATIGIVGLLKLENGRDIPGRRIWAVLGGSSYVLYLIHQPLGSVAIRLLRPLAQASPLAGYVVLSLAAIGAAIFIHLTIEKWMLRRLNRSVARPA